MQSKAASPAQTKVTTPKEQFGFNVGDDYQLATYTQLVDYWKKLAQESNRMTLVDIGKTAEGRERCLCRFEILRALRVFEVLMGTTLPASCPGFRV